MTCKDCIHSGLCYKENDYENFPDRCGSFIPERPQGEWLSHYDYCEKHGYNPSASIAFWWCNRCGQAVEQPTNFCPNCGADMKSGAV